MASILEERGFVMLEGQREQEEYLSKKPLVIIIRLNEQQKQRRPAVESCIHSTTHLSAVAPFNHF